MVEERDCRAGVAGGFPVYPGTGGGRPPAHLGADGHREPRKIHRDAEHRGGRRAGHRHRHQRRGHRLERHAPGSGRRQPRDRRRRRKHLDPQRSFGLRIGGYLARAGAERDHRRRQEHGVHGCRDRDFRRDRFCAAAKPGHRLHHRRHQRRRAARHRGKRHACRQLGRPLPGRHQSRRCGKRRSQEQPRRRNFRQLRHPPRPSVRRDPRSQHGHGRSGPGDLGRRFLRLQALQQHRAALARSGHRSCRDVRFVAARQRRQPDRR